MVSGISSYSTASISEMRQQLLSQIDTNSDGSIDKTEMATLIQQNTNTLVDSLFGKLDTDVDGLISLIQSNSDLAKLGQQMKHGGDMSAASGTQPPPPPEKVFDMADTNEDGVVSKEELAAVMGANGGDIGELFGKVDTDGDGLISRSEDEDFRKQMTEPMQPREAANSARTTSAPSCRVGKAGCLTSIAEPDRSQAHPANRLPSTLRLSIAAFTPADARDADFGIDYAQQCRFSPREKRHCF